MRWVKAVAVVLAVLGLGAGGWWYLTIVPRAVERAQRYGEPDEADLDIITRHADDPRVLAAAAALTKDLGDTGYCKPRKLEVLDAIYAKQPLTGTDGVRAATGVLNHCNHLGAKKWPSSSPSPAELASAARWTLREKFIGIGADSLVAWLEEANVPVDEDAMIAMGMALGIAPRATDYFTRGFPKDGAPLKSEPRIPIADDPRLVTAVSEALDQFNHLSPSWPDVGPALAKVTQVVKVPISDLTISAVLRLPKGSREAVAQNLFRRADVARIKKYAQDFLPWAIEAGVLASVLEALGAGSDDDAEAVIVGLAQDLPAEWKLGADEEAGRRRTASAVQTLAGMGDRGVRVARRHLVDAHRAVRQACLEVLFQRDRAHFVDALIAAGPKLAHSDVRRALELAKDEPRIQEVRLLALGYPMLVAEVRTALLKLPAKTLVPALFGLIAHRESFSPDEVAAYRELLRASPGSVTPTAQALDEALGRAGKPERVYWLTKLLALERLRDDGTAAERAVAEKFVEDTSSYEYVSITYDAKTGKELSRSPTTIAFATLAKEAAARTR